MTRRDFVKNGVTAFTVSLAAPAFLSDLARAQGASSRNLVVLDLTGGNDGLSMLVPYTDASYYSRRPTLAIPAGTVLQVGTDSSGKAAGAAPEADRAAATSSTRAASRWCSASATRTRAVRTFPAPTSGRRRTRPTPPAAGWVGRYLSHAAAAARSARPPGTPPATRRTRCCRRRCRWRRSPASPATRSAARTRATRRRSSGRPQRASRRTCRWTSRTWRSSAPRRRRRWRRSIGWRRWAVQADRRVSEQRVRPGAAGGCRRDGEGHRHQGLLGADRRLRHARLAGHRTATPARTRS